MEIRTNNKTIAKNTIFLYIRSLLTMVISLYTSRVILRTLGVDDYGIYQSVGGIVGLLAFVNGALSNGSSRFLTFEQGTGNFLKLKKTFATTLTIHILLAIIIALIAECFGVWFIGSKLQIPTARLDAAYFAFHISILTAVFSLTQVPYNASIIAHEKMSVYAYMSIVEVCLKLLICYLLVIGGIDRLKLYAVLLFVVQVGLMIFYRIYCQKNFEETKFSLFFDKDIFIDIAKFSGWSLFANCSIALNSQGILLLLNMFFSPAVVAARAISIQVNMAANQFVNNFRTAVNPQIVKRLASGDLNGSKQLLLQSTKFSYYLMFVLSLPICILAAPLLKIWLGIVPEYAVIFLQLIVIQSLLQVFDTSFYTALYAKGQLRENALLSPTLGLIRFPVIYVLFKCGFSPVTLSWASIFTYALLAFIIKPVLIVRICSYTWTEVFSVFKPCLLVTVASVPIPITLSSMLDIGLESSFFHFVLMVCVCIITTSIAIWFLGLNSEMKSVVLLQLRKKCKNK